MGYRSNNTFTIIQKIPKLKKLLKKHHDLAECNEIIYCWIPRHISIAGNENVDQKAKDSTNLHPRNFHNLIKNLTPDRWKMLLTV